MKTIQGDGNKVKETRRIIRNGEKMLANTIQRSEEIKLLIEAIASKVGELYGCSADDVAEYLDVGIQVSLGFDPIGDFAKEKMKLNPLEKQLQHDAIVTRKETQRREKLRKAQDSTAPTNLFKKSWFKQLVFLGGILPRTSSTWLEKIKGALLSEIGPNSKK